MPDYHFTGEDGSRITDLLDASVTGRLHVDDENGLVLEPDNLLDNPLMTERSHGEVNSYDLSGLPSEPIGYYVNVTPEGNPVRSMLMRQNTALIPLGDLSWTAEEEIVAGYRTSPTSERVADLPTITAVPATTKGYPPGRYGVAYGYSQGDSLVTNTPKPRKKPKNWGGMTKERRQTWKRRQRLREENRKKSPSSSGRRTPVSGIRYFDLLTGQIPRVFVPDSHSTGATHIDIYLTKPSGTVLFLQVSVPLMELRAFVDVPGPLKTTTPAQARNTTGIEPPRPRKRGRDFRLRNAPGMKVREGVYSPVPAFQLGTGITEAARIGDSITVRGDTELRQVGTEEVPVGTQALSMESLHRDYTPVSGAQGIADRVVRQGLGHYLYEALAAKAESLKPGESVRSDDARIVEEADALFAEDASRMEDRINRASGKLENSRYAERGGDYRGEELDAEEGHLIRRINEARAEEGLPNLVLNRDLNLIAYREAEGPRPTPEPDYPFASDTEVIETKEDSAADAFEAFSEPEYVRYLEAECIGVAREPVEGGYRWVLAYGDRYVTWDDVEEDEPDYYYCEIVDPEGNTHRYEERPSGGYRVAVFAPNGSMTVAPDPHDAFADLVETQNLGPTKTGHAVRNNTLKYTYSGSYAQTLDAAGASWNGHSKVTVSKVSGGGHVRVSDGIIPGTVYGRATTYEDNSGTIVGNSPILERNTPTSNEAMWRHEFGHLMALAHNEGDSCMQATVNAQITSVRPVDSRTVASVFGASATPTEPTDPTDPNEPPETEERPIYEMVNLGYKRNKCLEMDVPDLMLGDLNPDLRWIPYVYHESLGSEETGGRTCYRLYGRNATPTTPFDNTGLFKRVVRWSGFPPEAFTPGDAVRSVGEDPPTENTTRVAPPDPTSLLDPPGISGKRRPAAGSYLGSINYLYADGTVSAESEPQRVTITTDQMIRFTFPRTVNLLPNANFAQVDAQGIPTGWTTQNIASVTSNRIDTSEPGILRLEATTTTTSVPGVVSGRMPVSSERSITVGGRIALERLTDGRAQVNLRQFDSLGVALGEIECGRVEGLFELPFVKTLLPTDRHPECAEVDLRVFIPVGTTGANARAAFSYLRFFPFRSDLRQVAFSDGEDADVFEAGPEEPFPLFSFRAVGEPPVEQGGAVEEAEPPELLHGFSGPLPAGLTELISGGATGGVTTVKPIFGTHSYRSQDTTYTQDRHRLLNYDLAHSGGVSREGVAYRALYRFDGLPKRDDGASCLVGFHYSYDDAGRPLMYFRMNQVGGIALVRVSANGIEYQTPLATIPQGQMFDLEAIFVGGSSGSVTVGIGIGGQPRRIYHQGSFAYTNRRARHVRFGSQNSTDAKLRYDLYLDEVVVTEGGDVSSRERPAVPANYVPPPPDRPVLTNTTPPVYRTKTPEDQSGDVKTSQQLFVFVKPGDVTQDNPVVMPLLSTPMFVWPGSSYTFAAFRRYAVFAGATSPGVRVRLSGEELPDLFIESFTGTFGEMTGVRGWHDPARGTEDDHLIFSVPPPTISESGEILAYTECQLEFVLLPGVYLFQDMTFPRGIFATFAEREARRTLKRATEAGITTILDARPPAYESGPTGAGVYYSDFGVTHALAPSKTDLNGNVFQPTDVEVEYSTSPDLLTFSQPTPYENDVAYLDPTDPNGRGVNVRTPERHLRTFVLMTGDSWDTPRIAAGGIRLSTWSAIGQLVRSDGSPLPGGAWVGNLVSKDDHPETGYERVSGRVLRARESESVGSIGPLTVTVATEEARQELSALTRTEDLRLEIPTAGGVVAGEYLLVRPGAPIEWGEPETPRITKAAGERSHRETRVTGTIEWCEVLESGPLPGPISPPLRVASEMEV